MKLEEPEINNQMNSYELHAFPLSHVHLLLGASSPSKQETMEDERR